MRKNIMVLLFLLALNIYAEGNELEINEYGIIVIDTGIRISSGEPISEVKKKLGEPLKEILVKKDGEFPGFYHLKYPDLDIGYYEDDNRALLFNFTGTQYTTPRHITNGASRYEVLNRYGEAQYSDNMWLQYRTPKKSEKPWLEEVYALTFRFDEDNAVCEITIQESFSR
jgi:hypothetical protein